MWTRSRVKRQSGERRLDGFTVVEVIVVVLIIGAISIAVVPAFLQELQRAKMDRAIVEISLIETQIYRFFNVNDRFPPSLNDLVQPPPPDPWGKSYQYLTPSSPGWRGKFRKDRFLVPLNSDFDLYSSGPDGESRPPLRPKVSWDDIIRANNGGYIGLASDF